MENFRDGAFLVVLATLVFFGMTAWFDFAEKSGPRIVRGIAAAILAVAALFALL